jgi:hypothetical protein
MGAGLQRRNFRNALVLGLCVLAGAGSWVWTHSPSTPKSAQAEFHVPFVRNTGQVANPEVAYYAATFHGAVYVDRNGEIFYLLSPRDRSSGWVLKERFVGAATRTPRGAGVRPEAVSYIVGNDPREWMQGLSAYEALEWGEVYPNVRLSLRAGRTSAEKIFTVLPGGDPNAIRVELAAPTRSDSPQRESWRSQTAHGPVRFSRPVAYQERAGRREDVKAAYRLAGSSYGFSLGDFDKTRPVVIDPLLASTYLGGTANEPFGAEAAPMVRDAASGDLIVAGATASTDFPTTTGALNQAFSGICKLFVARFSSDLATLKAATYFGGSACDEVRAVALDGAGNVVLAGTATSNNFPTTPGAFKTTDGLGLDVFVTKLNSSLTTLVASTLLSGTGTNPQNRMHRRRLARPWSSTAPGNIFVAGTRTPTFPVTTGAAQATLSDGGPQFIGAATMLSSPSSIRR